MKNLHILQSSCWPLPPPYTNPSHSTSFTKLKVCFVWGAWHRKVHSTGRILKTAHLGRPPVSFCLLPLCGEHFNCFYSKLKLKSGLNECCKMHLKRKFRNNTFIKGNWAVKSRFWKELTNFPIGHFLAYQHIAKPNKWPRQMTTSSLGPKTTINDYRWSTDICIFLGQAIRAT